MEVVFFIKISLKFLPSGPINNMQAWIQIMAGRRSGNKPFPKPMMTKFTDTYMHHQASMSYDTVNFLQYAQNRHPRVHSWGQGKANFMPAVLFHKSVWSTIVIMTFNTKMYYINGSVQDFSISSALALEILQSCTKPSICDIQNNARLMVYSKILSIKQFFSCHMSFYFLQTLLCFLHMNPLKININGSLCLFCLQTVSHFVLALCVNHTEYPATCWGHSSIDKLVLTQQPHTVQSIA